MPRLLDTYICDMNAAVMGKYSVGEVVSATPPLGCWPLLPKVKRGRTLNVRVVGCKTLQGSTHVFCIFVCLLNTAMEYIFPYYAVYKNFIFLLFTHKCLNDKKKYF